MTQRLVLLMLVLPSLVAGKPSTDMKLLEAFPDFFKFVMFWWCCLVFGVMGIFILDQLYYKWRGPATVSWSTIFVFDGRASREEYWAQFIDPSAWPATHPILESADVRMVDFAPGDKDTDIVSSKSKEMEDALREEAGDFFGSDQTPAEPSTRLKPIEFKPFVPGLGLILRHKSSSGPREGLFFCSRECTSLEMPKDEPWHFEMKTVEAGAGHAFEPGSEKVEVVLHPTAEDGTIECLMKGQGKVGSRIWRWWMGLEKLSIEGAEAMLKNISDMLGQAKKQS